MNLRKILLLSHLMKIKNKSNLERLFSPTIAKIKIMNKTRISVLVLIAVLVSTMSFAQKGSVGKAQAYLDKSDLANAKAEIDVAITIEKTAAKSRTWYVRGQIYEKIASSEDMAVSSLDPDAIPKAMEAYNKVFEMEKEGTTYYTFSQLNIDTFWGTLLNAGGEAYGVDNYELALSKFEQALVVKPGDSTTLLYAGAASQQMDNTEKTLMYYEMMVDKGIASENVFSTVIYLRRQAGENDKALAHTLKAKESFPDNKTFASEELSLLIIMNKLDEAKMKLKSAISDDPSVVNNHLNLAVLYDNLGTKLAEDADALSGAEKTAKRKEARLVLDSAQMSYNNVIELDPKNYVANYNAGAIYVNFAKEYLDEARDMDLKTYEKKGAAMEDKGRKIIKEAIPYFKTVTEIKPEDIDAHTTLQTIYSILKMYDEAEAEMNIIEELEAAQAAGGE